MGSYVKQPGNASLKAVARYGLPLDIEMATNSYNNASDANWSVPTTANTTVHPDYGCVGITGTAEPEVELIHRICVVIAFICVVVGLIGNSLSMMVFSSKEMRVMSSNIYLLVLSISDSCYLISVFLGNILKLVKCLYAPEARIDIYNTSDSMCKILQFLLDLFSNYSTCLILAFTVERFLAVHRPVKFKEICTVKRARIACLVTFGVIALCIAPYHFLYMGVLSEFMVCTVLEAGEFIFTAAYAVEITVFRAVPVFVIAALNVYIISKVALVQKQKRRRSSSTRKRPSKSKREDKSMQLTIILILVSSSYIVAYMPTLVHFVLWSLTRKHIMYVAQASLDIFGALSDTLYILGFSVNFFLYTVSGRIFRKQLYQVSCFAIVNKNGKLVDATELTTL